jgi:signal peptide peptidase SppA
MLHPAVFELRETLWAIVPSRLQALVELLITTDAAGIRSDDTRQMFGASALGRAQRGSLVWGSTAVLPLFGVITHRESFLSHLFGGTSVMSVSANLKAALADPNVSTIVLDIDSPGGSVEGVQELSDEIFNARSKKHIVAVANATAASAAYWIGSAATELVVTASGSVGSIGVLAAHEDISKALEAKGIKMTVLTYGAHKAEDSPFSPLSEDARSHLQAMVNTVGEMFTSATARNRGVSTSTVQSSFGQGRIVLARDAVRARMADRVGTMTDTITRLGKKNIASNSAIAARVREMELLGGTKSTSVKHAARLREMQLYGDTVH